MFGILKSIINFHHLDGILIVHSIRLIRGHKGHVKAHLITANTDVLIIISVPNINKNRPVKNTTPVRYIPKNMYNIVNITFQYRFANQYAYASLN